MEATDGARNFLAGILAAEKDVTPSILRSCTQMQVTLLTSIYR
jgi:hypothetical protein